MEDNNGNSGGFRQPEREVQPADTRGTGWNGSEVSPPDGGNNTLGIIGLISGILGSLLSLCCGPLAIVLGLTALICGILAKGNNQRFAMAAIILGALSLVLGVVFLILGLAAFGDIMDEFIYQMDL